MKTPAPTRIDRYLIEGELGRGGFGVVYRARHSVIGRVVALKLLLPERSTTPMVLERFLREARAIAAIGSPHIVEIYDAGLTPGGEAFLAMELLEGEDLGQHLRRLRTLPVERAVEIIRDVLGALGAAHRAGIVHRDVKPGNVFLARAPGGGIKTKVLDFGISKIKGDGEGDALTMTGALLGTPHYMAPEQLTGKKDIDGRADLYSVATVLFELSSGELPYPALTLEALIAAKLSDPPRPLRGVAPHVPQALADVVQRGLAYDASARFSSADEMSHAIDVAMGGGRVAVGAAPTLAQTTLRPPDASPGGARVPSSRPPAVGAAPAYGPTLASTRPEAGGVVPGQTPMPSSSATSGALAGIVHSTAPGAAPGTVASPFLRFFAAFGVLTALLVLATLIALGLGAVAVTFLGYELFSDRESPSVVGTPSALVPAPVAGPAPAPAAPVLAPTAAGSAPVAPWLPPPAPVVAAPGALPSAPSVATPSSPPASTSGRAGVSIRTSPLGAAAAEPATALAERARPLLESCREPEAVTRTYQAVFTPAGAILAIHVHPSTPAPTRTDECVMEALRRSSPAPGASGIVRYAVTLEPR